MKYTSLTRFGAITMMFFGSLCGEPIPTEKENKDPRNIFTMTAKGIEFSSTKRQDGALEFKFWGKMNVKPIDLPVRIPENQAITLVLSKDDKEIITFPASYQATTAKDKGSSLFFTKGKGRFVTFKGHYLLGSGEKGEYAVDVKSVEWVIDSKKSVFFPEKGKFGKRTFFSLR